MKTLSKKFHGLLGMLLALALMVTCVLPAFAATDANGVEYTKSISSTGEDSYKLQLDVKGKDKVTTTSTTTPGETVTTGTNLVLVIDTSGSIIGKEEALNNAIQSLVTTLPDGSQVGVVLFNESAATAILTKDTVKDLTFEGEDSRGTNVGTGIRAATSLINSGNWTNKENGSAIVIISDFIADDYIDSINNAKTVKAAGTNIYSIKIDSTTVGAATQTELNNNSGSDYTASCATSLSRYVSNQYPAATAEGSGMFGSAMNQATVTPGTADTSKTYVYGAAGGNWDEIFTQIKQSEDITTTTTTRTPMTNVTITDKLSDNVKLKDGTVNVVASDGTNPAFTNNSNGDTVSVTINDALKDGVTYSLQFEVVPTDAAKEKANAASTDSVTLPTNAGATLSYNYGSNATTENFTEEPTITVNKDKVYTVTFKDGDATLATSTVKEGETVSSVTAPAKEGYTFENWYADEQLTSTYDFTQPVLGNTVIYANYVKNTEEEPTKTYGAIDFIKVLNVEGSDTAPTTTFTFNVTPVTNGAPAIAPVTANFGPSNKVENGKVTLTNQFTLDNLTWPETGNKYDDYQYTISEAKTGYDNTEWNTISYDDKTYNLYVRVMEVDGKLQVVDYNYEYVDATGKSTKSKDLTFENTYTHKKALEENLTVKKTITGKEADANTEFTFVVTWDKTVNDRGDVIASTQTKELTLKGGEEKSITIPAGAKYTVTEKGTSLWTGSVSVNGAEAVAGEAGKDLATGEQTIAETTDNAGNLVAYVNDYDAPVNPLTGFVKKNAAIFLAGILAIAVFAAYVFDRKRKAERKAARE